MPRIDVEDLQKAAGLRDRVSIEAADGRVSKIALSMSGTLVDWRRRRSYGRPDPNKPPPRPPRRNWRLGQDGYGHERSERSVNVTVKVGISGCDSTSISEEVRKKIGLR